MNGVVYRYSCPDVSGCYIGSSINLQKRESNHRSVCNAGRVSKFYDRVRATGGIDKWKCEVIENVVGMETVSELKMREQFHLDNCEGELLNKRGAYQTTEQWKKYMSDYYKDYHKRNPRTKKSTVI